MGSQDSDVVAYASRPHHGPEVEPKVWEVECSTLFVIVNAARKVEERSQCLRSGKESCKRINTPIRNRENDRHKCNSLNLGAIRSSCVNTMEDASA